MLLCQVRRPVRRRTEGFEQTLTADRLAHQLDPRIGVDDGLAA